MKHLQNLIGAVALLACFSASAQSYEKLSARANRFFEYEEWASATACYNFMLNERPDVVDTYGRDIVAYLMQNDSIQPQQLLTKAMSYNVPLDSVLNSVKHYSFVTSQGNLYEDFLLGIAKNHDWLQRPIDPYLLRYYDFRDNGPKMVAYATKLLNVSPRHVPFLQILARGYMLVGDYNKAVGTWNDILKISPDDYDTIINLATYYDLNNDKALALTMFEKAQKIRPTPYVEQKVERLR